MSVARLTVIFCLVCAGLAHGASLSVYDQLLQVDWSDIRDYRPLRQEKLELTPFDCGRVIIQPYVAVEQSVSVYSRPGGAGRRAYMVTLISCDRSLWQTTDTGRRAGAAALVKTRRIDCEIPSVTAEHLKTVWTRMLAGPHGPRPLKTSDLTSSDGIEADFSIQLPYQRTLNGMLPDMTFPPQNTVTGTLVAISNDLIAVCQAQPSARQKILSRIDRRTISLLGKIRKRDGESGQIF